MVARGVWANWSQWRIVRSKFLALSAPMCAGIASSPKTFRGAAHTWYVSVEPPSLDGASSTSTRIMATGPLTYRRTTPEREGRVC
jgi:hypothetical protein